MEIFNQGDKGNSYKPFLLDENKRKDLIALRAKAKKDLSEQEKIRLRELNKEDKTEWENALWKHHELFQDAVNYYTLALAAMAEGLTEDTPEGKAALEWRKQVHDSWVKTKRRALEIDGPHHCIAKLLGLDPTESDFDKCVEKLFKHTPSSKAQRAKALLQLLEEANKSDLNQICVARIRWLCTRHGALDATSKSVSYKQEEKMLKSIRRVHEAKNNNFKKIAVEMNVGYFLTQPPKNDLTGDEAIKEAEHQFEAVMRRSVSLEKIEDSFKSRIHQEGKKLKVPNLGRKPKGAYPFALVFKLFPTPETWKAFKDVTAGSYKRALKQTASTPKVTRDFIAEARTEQDEPIFDYFTNFSLVRQADDKNHAVWFEFDLAAFIEAIQAPHRYYQDTLKREKMAEFLRKKKLAMEGCGGEVDDEQEEDTDGGVAFGFEKDKRIALLRVLVTNTLGYVAEEENPSEEGEPIEYTIQERTLRGFEEIKRKWRKLADNNQATKEKLCEVLSEQQAKQRDDFGSAILYRALADPKFHPIWHDDGTEKWHAPDPLKAWQTYKELCFELEDKERPIRFTPAHSEHSPRYFIIPKQGRFRSEHQPGKLAFTCGMVLKTNRGLEALKVCISYSAPRLKRDELRHEVGDENLGSVSWLQPMMTALGFDKSPEKVNFANCRITFQPETPHDIQLTFPIEINTEKIKANVARESIWQKQFTQSGKDTGFAPMTLRWPHEKQLTKPPDPWYEEVDSFRCIAVDLGQRDAGAFARLITSNNNNFGKKPSRFIGETGDKQWRTALERSGLFRLPGEDAQVWREISEFDKRNAQDSGKPFDFRQEFWGERGRWARDWEAKDTSELMRLLEVLPENKEHTLLPDNWCNELSFPEQNDKLLIAMRRYQSRIAQLHRWCWFLKSNDKQKEIAHNEIAECADQRLITAELKELIKKGDPRGWELLKSQIGKRLELASDILVRIANRILPLRGRSWCWEEHPNATKENLLYHLTQNGLRLDSKERPVWLRGQRGLSMERIEQIEELRKRCQSLNQTLRRTIGSKPPIRRDESVPDPCPDLLEKLDNLKKQRVNQTAHMILAEALGLRLAPPPANKKALRREKDQHGAYEKIFHNSGNRWIGPVDFIVIEDLSRYRASQGRAPRENSRLMKWCHRAVRDKLKQLCEVFGLPVLETPAAYSSRFCSRSGVAGFRAVEIAPGFEKEFPWSWLKEKKDGNQLSQEAQKVQDLIKLVNEANQGRDGKQKKYRTFLAPLVGGPIFVPIVDHVKGAEIQPVVVQADINAAINLGLRSISDPRLWSIHPRLRTEHKNGKLVAKEKRKFGVSAQIEITPCGDDEKQKKKDGRNPNYFADFSNEVAWGSATLEGKCLTTQLVSGKALWSTVNDYQWKRCEEINQKRMEKGKTASQ
ncbi:MAG: type V CRISPR-associated protein Cas12b [Candidatus Omnitrophota bacterium]